MTGIDLKGRVAIVTGAARGIGLTVARNLACDGVRVWGTDLRAELLAIEMDKLAEEFGVDALCVGVDVGFDTQGADMVGQAFARLGEVDVLVNTR